MARAHAQKSRGVWRDSLDILSRHNLHIDAFEGTTDVHDRLGEELLLDETFEGANGVRMNTPDGVDVPVLLHALATRLDGGLGTGMVDELPDHRLQMLFADAIEVTTQ